LLDLGTMGAVRCALYGPARLEEPGRSKNARLDLGTIGNAWRLLR